VKTYVLDAHAVLAYCQGERGSQAVENLLLDAHAGRVTLLMSVVNWGEVYYALARKQGKPAAEVWRADFSRLPVELIDADPDTAYSAAGFKTDFRLPYADSFAAAAAKLRNATVVTGDPEFERVESDLSVLWLS
jgi:predicted nucleic acid-binding protein